MFKNTDGILTNMMIAALGGIVGGILGALITHFLGATVGLILVFCAFALVYEIFYDEF